MRYRYDSIKIDAGNANQDTFSEFYEIKTTKKKNHKSCLGKNCSFSTDLKQLQLVSLLSRM